MTGRVGQLDLDEAVTVAGGFVIAVFAFFVAVISVVVDGELVGASLVFDLDTGSGVVLPVGLEISIVRRPRSSGRVGVGIVFELTSVDAGEGESY